MPLVQFLFLVVHADFHFTVYFYPQTCTAMPQPLLLPSQLIVVFPF